MQVLRDGNADGVTMQKKVEKILSGIRPECDFAASSDFTADGLLDSFDVVMLVNDLDSTFSISIDGTDIIPENFSSIEAILSLLRKHGARE
jgi:acyl carrier protein